MSNSPKNLSLASSGSNSAKKRKRKRNNKAKNVKAERDEIVVEKINNDNDNDFHIGRQNKKLKFDDDEEEEENSESRNLEEFHEQVEAVKKEEQEIPHDESSEDIKQGDAESEIESVEEGTVQKKEHNHITVKHKQHGNKQKEHKGPKRVVYDSDEEEDGYAGNSFFKAGSTGKEQLQKKANELLEVRKKLPIYQHKDEIIQYVNENQVTVLIGETGSGKSTQIPQFLMPLNKKQIAVTQPRRVAAASLAERVSEEFGCPLGQEVGYQVRFSNVTHPVKTKLKYLTDGMLLREIMLDEKLTKYTTIIIDEAHERTILTDLILGFLKELLKSGARKDLKVIVMSATLNAELFSKFFDNAPILYVEGKMYPVTKYYLADSSEDIVDAMIRSVVQVNMSEQVGDILCFLPGQEEIDNCVNTLENLAPLLPKEAPLIVPIPLYAALSPAQQAKVFDKLPNRRRKVILATNIAETSITVSGVKYVIDSGLRKVKVWKHQLGLSTLLTTPISQASAKQRSGRAGRESEGKVFRLYLESIYLNKLPKQQESEIMRTDTIFPVLTLKKIGVDDLLNWSWLEHPGKDSILSALHTLYSLGALDDKGQITSLGYKIAILPIPPQMSVVLITALEFGVLNPVIDIVACLSVDNLILNVGGGNGELRDEINFMRRQYCPLGCKFGDLITLKEYFNYFKELSDKGNSAELKAWCKELHFSYKGFKNVMKVRTQLKDYLLATLKQDDSLSKDERDTQIKRFKSQIGEDDDEEDLKKPLDTSSILKSFLKGYITNTAIGMPDRSYRTLTSGQLISIHPSSNLFGKANLDAIMYIEYVFTTKGYARSCSTIELSWLQEIAPQVLGATRVNVAE